jgi:hypothetical protein
MEEIYLSCASNHIQSSTLKLLSISWIIKQQDWLELVSRLLLGSIYKQQGKICQTIEAPVAQKRLLYLFLYTQCHKGTHPRPPYISDVIHEKQLCNDLFSLNSH